MLPNRTYSKAGFIFVSSLPMCPPGCLESFAFFRVSISSRKRRVPTDPLHSPRQAQLATLLAEAGSLRIQQEDLQQLRHVGNEWHRRPPDVAAGPGVRPVLSQDELFRCSFLEQSSDDG